MLKTITEDQEMMWNVLANNAEYLAHKWAEELVLLKGKKFNKVADHYLGFIVSNFDNEEAARTIKTWLTTYQMVLEPDSLKNFDAFHSKFGSYIISDEIKNLQSY